jgi:hypothetical protein
MNYTFTTTNHASSGEPATKAFPARLSVAVNGVAGQVFQLEHMRTGLAGLQIVRSLGDNSMFEGKQLQTHINTLLAEIEKLEQQIRWARNNLIVLGLNKGDAETTWIINKE